jgi:opacity protein-like surface antigen
MKKSLSLLAVLAVAGVATTTTPADAATRYVSGMAGMSWFNDSDVTATTNLVFGEAQSGIATFDNGFTATLGVGCDYGPTRAELELGYQRNDLNPLVVWDDLSGYQGEEDGFVATASGKTTVYSLMANGYVDIPVGSGVELYAMAGVGVAQVNNELAINLDEYSYGSLTSSGQIGTHDSHETTLAYQLGAGIAIPVSKGVMLDAKYRYFATSDFTLNTGVSYIGDFYPTSLTTNISSHSVLLGLRVDI